jgi:hypothetical protein
MRQRGDYAPLLPDRIGGQDAVDLLEGVLRALSDDVHVEHRTDANVMIRDEPLVYRYVGAVF